MNFGDIVGERYSILEQIGSGGFSSVFLASDKISQKIYALKILNCDISDDEKQKQFRQEAMTLANINHPNVVHISDFGTFYDENEGVTKAFIATDYIRGKSLRKIIDDKGVLLIDEFVLYIEQILDGLEACHNKNIFHRDIKPQNFVWTASGKIVLIDFGTALIGGEYKKQNLIEEDNKLFRGTVQYMSPEHFKNPSGSKQSDIYALGISMFELLTGKLPFTSNNPNKLEAQKEIVRMQVKCELPSIRKINPNVPESFEKIVNKCCAKGLNDRYKNISELRVDLRNANSEYKNIEEPKKGFFQRLFGKKS